MLMGRGKATLDIFNDSPLPFPTLLTLSLILFILMRRCHSTYVKVDCIRPEPRPRGSGIIPRSKVIFWTFELFRYAKSKPDQAERMPSKDEDIFYLKLQWISSKDEAERKKLADKISQLLTERSKGAT